MTFNRIINEITSYSLVIKPHKQYEVIILSKKILEENRCEILAEYLIQTQCTVRDAAAHFGISKSTVHKDVTERLKQRNKALYELVRELLNKNKSLRHLRGGEATRKKYYKLKIE